MNTTNNDNRFNNDISTDDRFAYADINADNKNDFDNKEYNFDEEFDSPKKKKKYTRRVGTITFGFTLIFTGVVIVMSLFGFNINLITVLKMLPLLLVAYGLEIVLSAVFIKDAKFKYDILGMFLSFVIVLVSVTGAFIAKYGEQLATADEKTHSIIREMENDVEDMLISNSTIESIDVYTDGMYDTASIIFNQNWEENIRNERKYITVNLIKSYDNTDSDKIAFAENARDIANLLYEGGVENYDLSIHSYAEDYEDIMSISVTNGFAQNMATEDLVKLIHTN